MKIAQRSISFSADVQASKLEEEEIEQIAKASSLESLKDLYPTLKEGNEDLLKVSFNVAVANLVNSNGHGILGADANEVMESFVHKPFNIEHETSMIVGHATNYGFTSFGENKIIPKITARYSKRLEPFNMALGGVVYKRADNHYADLLKESATDERSYWYNSISASWEMLYDEYVIALGSKRLADAEIITDDKQVAELTKYLADEKGGSGFMNDGTPVYRIVSGGLLGAGSAFTFHPAADVKGLNVEDESDAKKKCKKVYSNEDTEEFANEEDKPEIEASKEKENILEIVAEIKKDVSQLKDTSVTKKRIMKIKDITDINEDTLKEVQASEIRDFIKVELAEAAKKYEELEAAKAEAEKAKADELQAKADEVEEKVQKVSELEASVESLQEELKEIKEAKAAQEKQDTFNARMETIDNEFEVEDEQRAIFAKQIRDLSDEEFKSWVSDLKTILASKPETETETEEEEGGSERTLSSASSTEDVPNAQDQEEDSSNDLEKYRKSFAKATVTV